MSGPLFCIGMLLMGYYLGLGYNHWLIGPPPLVATFPPARLVER